MGRIMVIVGLVVLSVITVAAFWFEGLAGFPAAITSSFAAGQIYLDLVIAIVMIDVWVWHDAKAQGRNPWPWIIGSLIVGSFAPLGYLLSRD